MPGGHVTKHWPAGGAGELRDARDHTRGGSTIERAFGGEPAHLPWTGAAEPWKPATDRVDDQPANVDRTSLSVDEPPATVLSPRNYILW